MKETTNDVYEGYIEKKGWHSLFLYTDAEAGLFEHELALPLSDSTVKRLVDIGYGSGSLLSWARSRGLEAHGVEVQQSLLDAGVKNGFPVHRHIGAFSDNSADIITGMDVVEHMTAAQMKQMLAECRRVLRGDGWLVLRTPNCQSPAGLIDQFGDSTHRQMLSGPILSDFLSKAGFEVLSVRGAKASAEFNPNLAVRLRNSAKRLVRIPARLLLRLALGTGIVIFEPSVIEIARNKK